MSTEHEENAYNIDIPKGNYSDSEVRHFVSRALVQGQIKEINGKIDSISILVERAIEGLNSRLDKMLTVLTETHTVTDRRMGDHAAMIGKIQSQNLDCESERIEMRKRISTIENRVPEGINERVNSLEKSAPLLSLSSKAVFSAIALVIVLLLGAALKILFGW